MKASSFSFFVTRKSVSPSAVCGLQTHWVVEGHCEKYPRFHSAKEYVIQIGCNPVTTKLILFFCDCKYHAAKWHLWAEKSMVLTHLVFSRNNFPCLWKAFSYLKCIFCSCLVVFGLLWLNIECYGFVLEFLLLDVCNSIEVFVLAQHNWEQNKSSADIYPPLNFCGWMRVANIKKVKIKL